ncbi:MAG TPA: Crp/Fnr family transcriptional regulator [Microvirga sp.]|jgi:CRP-like cAMP-binding protein
MPTSLHDAHPIVTKLESILTLSDEEKVAILSLPMQVVTLRPDQDIVREGDRPLRCCALLEGFACTYKMTPNGKRQIMSFYIPGDIPDLQSLHLNTLDNSLGTLTSCRVGFIQHESVRDLCRAYPRIAGAFWRETLVDGAIFREWILNIGQREAYGRLAHLLCEMVTRLRSVGLVQDDTCNLPMTQGELADATGISTVHVNRTLQDLRGAGLINLKGGTLQVLDWKGLRDAGEFHPGYLHLVRPNAAAA